MIECAVFLAIFRPAAEVAEGCFRFGEVVFVVGVVGVDGSSLGFIWIIFLARLGGGGRSSFFALPDSVRFLWMTGEVGGERFMAAGGSEKAPSITALSWAVGSVEDAGVGGNLARGIARVW